MPSSSGTVRDLGASSLCLPALGSSTVTIRYGYVDTPLGQVHYRESGAGPPVVLFHESPLSGRIFEACLPHLGQRVRAIAPDTPGYGASEPPPGPIDIERYAERFALFLDALQLGEVALVGSHTGGSIAIQLAVEHPERIKALVILGSPLFDEEESRRWIANYLDPFPLAADGSQLDWLWRRYQRIWGADTPADLLHLATTEFLRTAHRYDWGYRAAFNFPAAERLPRLACPVLILTTEGDMLRDKHEPSLALTPNARGELFPSPWGQLPARHPEEFSGTVATFLEDVSYLR